MDDIFERIEMLFLKIHLLCWKNLRDFYVRFLIRDPSFRSLQYTSWTLFVLILNLFCLNGRDREEIAVLTNTYAHNGNVPLVALNIPAIERKI